MKLFTLRADRDAEALWGCLKDWRAANEAGRPFVVEIRHDKEKRSRGQNALYWARLADISDQFQPDGRRYSRDALHEFFRRQFLPVEELPDGTTMASSTTHLDATQFSEYLLQVEAYACQEMGVRFIER